MSGDSAPRRLAAASPIRSPRSKLRLRPGAGRAFLALGLLLPAAAGRRAEAQTPAAVTDEALVEQVASRLLAVAVVPEKLKPYWAPKISVQSTPEKDPNAFAHCIGSAAQPRYEAVMTPEILKTVVKQDRDILAFFLGHELSHILLGHTDCAQRRSGESELAELARGRDQERAADSLGMQLAVKAGFSYRRATRGVLRFIETSGDGGSSFQRLAASHPSWFDRAAFVNSMEGDRQQAALWQAMGAFGNGNYFLMVEQYEAAARAFKQVTTEFSGAYEAWANLGFSLLMRYCDGLDADDLRRFDVGQLVMPGFYRRPESLEAQVRGINSDLWWEAVGALREAVRLKPDLTLAKAHLGIAHLIHPSGTRDVGNATKFLKEAAALAANDGSISPLDRVAIGINAGVAELAAGGEAANLFAQALQALESSAGAARQQGGPLVAALDYNRSLLLESTGGADGRREAVRILERYLRTAAPASAWWQIGYERYGRLSRAAGVQPKPEAEFRRGRSSGLRTLAGIEVKPGVVLTLGDPVAVTTKRMGAVTPVPAVAGTNLVLLRYAAQGVELLANDRILAIVLRGTSAPTVPVRTQGLGSQTEMLRIGMTEADLLRIAGEFYDMKRLTSDDVYYRYYRELGLGVRVAAGRVEEIVVAQIPNRI